MLRKGCVAALTAISRQLSMILPVYRLSSRLAWLTANRNPRASTALEGAPRWLEIHLTGGEFAVFKGRIGPGESCCLLVQDTRPEIVIGQILDVTKGNHVHWAEALTSAVDGQRDNGNAAADSAVHGRYAFAGETEWVLTAMGLQNEQDSRVKVVDALVKGRKATAPQEAAMVRIGRLYPTIRRGGTLMVLREEAWGNIDLCYRGGVREALSETILFWIVPLRNWKNWPIDEQMVLVGDDQGIRRAWRQTDMRDEDWAWIGRFAGEMERQAGGTDRRMDEDLSFEEY